MVLVIVLVAVGVIAAISLLVAIDNRVNFGGSSKRESGGSTIPQPHDEHFTGADRDAWGGGPGL